MGFFFYAIIEPMKILNEHSYHIETVYNTKEEMAESEKTIKEEGYTKYITVTEQEDGSYFVAIDDVDDRDEELYHKLPKYWDNVDDIWNLVKDRAKVSKEEFSDAVDYHELTYYTPWEALSMFENDSF